MPIGAVLGGVSAAATGASAISNLVNGGGGSQGGYSGGSSAPQAYIPAQQPWADQGFVTGTQAMQPYASSIPGYSLPLLQSATQAQVGNPYSNYAQYAANQAAGYGTGYAVPDLSGTTTQAPATGAPAAAAAPGSGLSSGFNINDPSTWPTANTDGSGAGTGHDFIGNVKAYIAQGLSPADAWNTSTRVFSSQGLSQYIPSTASPAAAAPAAGAGQGQPFTAPQPTGQPSLVGMQQGGAGSLYGLGGAATAAAPLVLNSAFDPLNSVYNQQLQKTTDQANAIASMYGLQGAAGAGVTNQAVQNFNNQWQQQQLARQLQGTQALGNLANTAGTTYGGAANLGSGAINTLTSAGGLPYGTFNTQQGNIVNALNGLSSGATNAFGLDQQTLNELATYLRLGQSGTTVGQAGAAQNFANNQTLGSNLGSALSGLTPAINAAVNYFTPSPGYNGGNFTTPYSAASAPGYNTGSYYGGYADPTTGYAIGP